MNLHENTAEQRYKLDKTVFLTLRATGDCYQQNKSDSYSFNPSHVASASIIYYPIHYDQLECKYHGVVVVNKTKRTKFSFLLFCVSTHINKQCYYQCYFCCVLFSAIVVVATVISAATFTVNIIINTFVFIIAIPITVFSLPSLPYHCCYFCCGHCCCCGSVR